MSELIRFGMHKLIILLPPLLTACVGTPPQSAPLTGQRLRPAVESDDLRGRWLIEAVNGQPTKGPWLEFGGEGSVVIIKRPDGGINIGSAQPPTSAYLGCNNLRLTGWTRNGDKLSLGLEGSTMTERGCDESTMAFEDAAYEILRKAMTMEFGAPGRLRLINEMGTLDLKRAAPH